MLRNVLLFALVVGRLFGRFVRGSLVFGVLFRFRSGLCSLFFGGTVTTVRSNYMPVFRDLISLIPFQDWIYDSVEGVYTASFTRSYSLGVTFKVVDTDGNVGYTTDDMTVTLN